MRLQRGEQCVKRFTRENAVVVQEQHVLGIRGTHPEIACGTEAEVGARLQHAARWNGAPRNKNAVMRAAVVHDDDVIPRGFNGFNQC